MVGTQKTKCLLMFPTSSRLSDRAETVRFIEQAASKPGTQAHSLTVLVLGERKAVRPQNVHAFLRRKHSEDFQLPVPPPPLRMAMSMVTCQGKKQEKEQSRGLSILFFHPATRGQVCVN